MQPVDLFTTCPPSYNRSDREAYIRDVSNVSHWSEEAGCAGMLIYTDNAMIDPWMLAQIVIQNTHSLMPLVAVQPVYQHPYTVAKTVSTLGYLYGRRLALNMVAGGFKNDLVSLNDTTPHDRRYARLIEYTTILKLLLAGCAPVNFKGEFYQVSNLTLKPRLPAELQPLITVSGSSTEGLSASQALNAVPVKYPEPPERCKVEPVDRDRGCGIRVGVIAREGEAEAWHVAEERFPTDRTGQLAHQLAMKVSDSSWHRQLSELAGSISARSTYWMVPFEQYRTFCPYLVGDYRSVGAELGRYVSAGFNLFILDVPPSADELEHIRTAFAHAG